jgi:spermidine/putrescine transport system permease protein
MRKLFKIKEFHILLFPPAFWLLIFFIVPMIIVLIYSVSLKETYGGVSPGFKLEHYKAIAETMYLKIFLRSFGYALITTLATMMLAFPIAYYMTFASARTKIIVMLMIMIPFWTNFLIRMYALMTIMGESGLINDFLVNTGIVREPLNLFNNTLAVFVGFIYWNLPFMVLPIFSALDGLDNSLLEASLDLGATKRQTFLRITLPYSVPGLIAGIIFVFVPTMGNFIIPEFMGGTDNYMIGNLITSQFIQARNWPLGSTLSIMMIFFVMIFISIYLRFYNPSRNKGLLNI